MYKLLSVPIVNCLSSSIFIPSDAVTIPVKKLNPDAANCRATLALLASFRADILRVPDDSSNSKFWFVLVLR